MDVSFEKYDEGFDKWWAEVVSLSGDRLPASPTELEGWEDTYDVYGCYDSFMEPADFVAMVFDSTVLDND